MAHISKAVFAFLLTLFSDDLNNLGLILIVSAKLKI